MGTEKKKYKKAAFTQFYSTPALVKAVKQSLRQANIAKKPRLNRSAFMRGLLLFALDRLEYVNFDDPRISGENSEKGE